MATRPKTARKKNWRPIKFTPEQRARDQATRKGRDTFHQLTWEQQQAIYVCTTLPLRNLARCRQR